MHLYIHIQYKEFGSIVTGTGGLWKLHRQINGDDISKNIFLLTGGPGCPCGPKGPGNPFTL